MKLKDLLVQELPKRGGWPECTLVITQDLQGELCLWKKIDPFCCHGSWEHSSGAGLQTYWYGDDSMDIADDHASAIVTREQYEAALAAAQQPVWSGDGLPPVGCECEMQNDRGEWIAVIIIAQNDGFSFGWNYDYRMVYFSDKPAEFRPIRSEADKKRDAIIEALAYHTNAADAADLYKAIEAGEVEGVKLDV